MQCGLHSLSPKCHCAQLQWSSEVLYIIFRAAIMSPLSASHSACGFKYESHAQFTYVQIICGFHTLRIQSNSPMQCTCTYAFVSQGLFLPFPTQYAVDKQASPQTQKGRPAPSTHICNMRTFHCWRSKRERDNKHHYQVIWASGQQSTPTFHHIRCQQACRCAKTTPNIEVEAVRETLLPQRCEVLGPAPQPLSLVHWQHMNQTEWPCHMHWAITCHLTHALYIIILNYPSRWQRRILHRNYVGDCL